MGPLEAGARGKGREASRRARPSRSRPWLAVTVPETAGDVGSGGRITRVWRDPRRRVMEEGRKRCGSVSRGRRTPGPERSGISPVPYFAMAEVSNHAAACVVRKGRHRTITDHGDPSVVGDPRLAWVSDHADPSTVFPDRSDPTLSLASPSRTGHVSPTSCRPCAASPTNSSRPRTQTRTIATVANHGRPMPWNRIRWRRKRPPPTRSRDRAEGGRSATPATCRRRCLRPRRPPRC
jgi:hypothetical protein